MAFLPFYAPTAAPPTVVIVGGGYAGMAALVSIYRYCPSAEIILIDPAVAISKLPICTSASANPLQN